MSIHRAPEDAPVVFPPTLREVMLRPRWIAMLLVCLVVAGVFSWLLQWQLARAISTEPIDAGATEVVRPLLDVAAPGEYFDDSLGGQIVAATGEWAEGDFVVVGSRFNDGVEGWWVTGQFRVSGAETPASVAVALGWTDSHDDARAVAAQLNALGDFDETAIEGRLIADEGPVLPDTTDDPFEPQRMSPAQLLGIWRDVEVGGDQIAVWRGWVAASDAAQAPGGMELTSITSTAPAERAPINWLNLFYAAEWAIFAIFSFYLWYRLAKDAWQREVEEVLGFDEDE